MRFAIARILAFIVVFTALASVWQRPTTASFRNAWMRDAVVIPAAWCADLLTPAIDVRHQGSVLSAASGNAAMRGGINVVNGCDGTDALFLLWSILIASPLGMSSRVIGMLVGTVLVYALNEIRLLGLFYLHGSSPELFDVLHGYIAPIVMVVSIVSFFYVWSSRNISLPRPSG